MRPAKFKLFIAAFAAVSVAALLVGGCGKGDQLTAAGTSELVLAEASATVNGVSIAGQTVRVGQNNGAVRFEARLVGPGNHPAPGYRMRVEYNIPGMGMHHQRTGTFILHDDGTHGDLVPHDGIYCYEDTSGQYGCHASDARPGEYHYDFCGIGTNGNESNHINVTTVLEP